MTFGEACRKLREQGYTNLWSLKLWEKASMPDTMTDEFIKQNDTRLQKHGSWDLNGNRVVFVRQSDGVRLQIYAAA